MDGFKKTLFLLLWMAGSPPVALGVDAKDVLVSPEFVVATALQYADEIALIENELVDIAAAAKRIDANFVTTVDGRLDFLDSRAESIQPFSPSHSQGKTLTLGVSRQFETGTVARAQVEGSHRDAEYDAPSPAEGGAYETGLAVSLRQSLWRNAFGRTVEQQRAALKYRDIATMASIEDRKAQYALQVSSIFFNAWQAIAQVRAAEKRLSRQRDLFKITRIKFDRGTSEQPDYLQVNAALTLMEDRVEEARNVVGDIWTQLVSILKLPKPYAEMDPMKISIDLGKALATVDETCSAATFAEFSRAKASLASVEAAEAGMKASQLDVAPEVYLEARFATNGINSEFVPSTEETALGQHPQTTISIGFEMPLGYPRAQADILEAMKRKNAAALQLEKIRSNYETERPILCAEIRRLESKKNALTKALKMQTQRASLEDQRFRLGKVESFNVIQAENDVTDVQSSLDVLMAEMNYAAWQLLYLNDRILGYVANSSSRSEAP